MGEKGTEEEQAKSTLPRGWTYIGRASGYGGQPVGQNDATKQEAMYKDGFWTNMSTGGLLTSPPPDSSGHGIG